VESAIDKAIQDHPSYFDMNDIPVPSSPRVLNGDGYMNAVIANLVAAGFCVNRKDDVIEIRNTNDFSEDYEVLRSAVLSGRGGMVWMASAGSNPTLSARLASSAKPTGGPANAGRLGVVLRSPPAATRTTFLSARWAEVGRPLFPARGALERRLVRPGAATR
jgi:hypothetical protein